MRRIAITNLKGGVGKTTTAVNLAAALARQLGNVLLMDLDPQVDASATSWLAGDEDRRVLDALIDDDPPLVERVQATGVDGLDLIAGSRVLARAETLLSGEPGGETVLGARVRALPERWRLMMLDTPPSQGWLLHAALTASTDVLVVVESGTMALGSLRGLDRIIRLVRERLNPELRLFGVLQCRADPRTRLYREVADLLHAQFPGVAFDTVLRSDVRMLEAPGHQRDILDYAPSSRAAADVRALADEVAARLDLATDPAG
ncbi:MAG: ParA family protein [Acidobacteriota bacterium]